MYRSIPLDENKLLLNIAECIGENPCNIGRGVIKITKLPRDKLLIKSVENNKDCGPWCPKDSCNLDDLNYKTCYKKGSLSIIKPKWKQIKLEVDSYLSYGFK